MNTHKSDEPFTNRTLGVNYSLRGKQQQQQQQLQQQLKVKPFNASATRGDRDKSTLATAKSSEPASPTSSNDHKSPSPSFDEDSSSVTYEEIYGQRSSISSCSSTDSSYASSTSSGASSLYSLKYIDEEGCCNESTNSPNDSLYSNSSSTSNPNDTFKPIVSNINTKYPSNRFHNMNANNTDDKSIISSKRDSPAKSLTAVKDDASNLKNLRNRSTFSDDKLSSSLLNGHRFTAINSAASVKSASAAKCTPASAATSTTTTCNTATAATSECNNVKKLDNSKNWTPINNCSVMNVALHTNDVKCSSIGVKAIREKILNATANNNNSLNSGTNLNAANANNNSVIKKLTSETTGLLRNVTSPGNSTVPSLIINDLDFSDLSPDDDTDVLSSATSSSVYPPGGLQENSNAASTCIASSSGVPHPPPPPPPLPNDSNFSGSTPPPPPPLPLPFNTANNKLNTLQSTNKSTVMLNRCLSTSVLNSCDTLDSLSSCPSSTFFSSSGKLTKNKRTIKLFWKEVKEEKGLLARLNRKKTIWDEVKPVNIDCHRLEVLFENRSKDLPNKKMQEGKKSELILLNAKRSNFINIGLKKLPPPRAIKTAILKMDTGIINREGIDKLLTMIPTDEEINSITEAKLNSPDLPLGSAESFLLILSQIPALEQRLKFWAFKIDFDSIEKEMGEQLMDLKLALEEIEKSETLKLVLGTLLAMGNFLNGNEVKGFQLEYLSKIPEVKDTIHKNSLLYHLINIILEKFPNSGDLYSEMTAVTRASRVDYDELVKNLAKMSSDCKLTWDYCNVICKYDIKSIISKDMMINRDKMTSFITNCSNRISVLQVVQRRVFNRFRKILIYLGFSSSAIKELKPHVLLKILSEFALEYRTTRERVKELLDKKSQLSTFHSSLSKNRGRNCLEANSGSDSLSDHSVDCELRAILTQGYTDSMMDNTGSSDYILPSTRSGFRNNSTNNARLRKGKSIGNLYLASTMSSCGSSTSSEASYYSTCSSSTSSSSNSADDELLETLVKTVTGGPMNRLRARHSNSRSTDRKSLNNRNHGIHCYDEDDRAMVYTSLHDVRLAQEITY